MRPIDPPKVNIIRWKKNFFDHCALEDLKDDQSSEYKLHISVNILSHDEEFLAKIKDVITDLLTRYLESRTITQFKVCDLTMLGLLDPALKTVNLMNDYFRRSKSPKNVDINTAPELYTALKNSMKFFNPNAREPASFTPKEIERRGEQLAEWVNALKRFTNNGQCTIYLPSEFDKEKIAIMCHEIEDCLSPLGLAQGLFLDVQSPINTFITLRKEHLSTDPKDDAHRVNAHAIPKNDEERRVRQLIKQEQDECELYRYLRAYRPAPASAPQTLFPPAPATREVVDKSQPVSIERGSKDRRDGMCAVL